jgi:spermidine synthase
MRTILSRRFIIYAIFVVSGATSLAYEVTWTRLLVRVFGGTSFAVATVLASYMAGLALGSYLLGKRIDRGGNPVRVYGFLELGIGVFALVFPFVILGLNLIYGAISPAFQERYHLLTLVRFALSFLVLLIPTTLMGGTLPVLSKYVAGDLSNLARRIGALYAVNTFGAVAGAFGTGYLLLPNLGINHTTWLCVGLNVAIFGAAMVISRGPAPESLPAVVTKDTSRDTASGHTCGDRVGGEAQSQKRARVVLVAFMLTGFAALSIEILWTRVLCLVIGTTVYAFSAMLGTFLLGLAAGSAVFARLAQRLRRPGLVLGLVVAAIGVAVFLGSVAFGKLPLLYMHVGQDIGWSWGKMMWAQFLFCLLIMLAPTFLMGGTFPLVTRIYVRDLTRVGSKVGTAYAFNTVGSIFGSFAGSFVFLQFLGIKNALTLVSAIYLTVGIALLVTVAELRGLRRLAVAASALVLAVIAFAFPPRWDAMLMTSAVYRYAQMYRTTERLKENLKEKRLLFYDDGPGATVSVEKFQDELSLAIDGKADASTGITDMTTQTMISHLPLLFHPRPDTVLVIGLGCGMSLGAAERYPCKSIECVELLENVVKAARYFDAYTSNCLADPRLHLIVGDGRNHILLTKKKYDVIISQPTNPWIAGVGDLFTKEYLEMAKRRLKPNGIICVWFETYYMGDGDLRSMVKTFLSVFPYASMWMANEVDVIFLGSLAPLSFDDRLAATIRTPAIASDLKRVWINDITDVLSCYVWGTDGLERYSQREKQLHTDDNMMLEYSIAKKVFQTTNVIHLSNFLAAMETPPLERMDSQIAERARIQIEARRKALTGTLEFLSGKAANAIALYDAAFALAPRDPYVLWAYTERHLTLAQSLAARGDYDAAAENYGKAAVEPDYPRSWVGYDGLAFCAMRKGDYQKARQFYELSLKKNTFNRSSSYNLAKLYLGAGDVGAAISLYEKVLELYPGDAEAANGLARVYVTRNERLDAALNLAKIAASGTQKASYQNTLGWVYYSMGDFRDARKALKKAVRLEPGNSEALLRLGLVELTSANPEEAKEVFERLVGLGREDEYTDKAQVLLRELETK